MIVRPVVCRPFIGRRDEIEYLHEQRRRAAASHGGLVLVSGDAGLGKSRLVAEFCLSLGYSRWRIETAQCLEFAQRPYGPILDLLERLDPPAADAPATSKAQRFEQFIDTFARLTARKGLVLVIEDVHWADAATTEFLVHLADRVEGMRMLVVATIRPGHVDVENPRATSLAKLARTRHGGRIELAALQNDDLRRFIDETLDGFELEAAAKREIAIASDGNPFFVEELLKAAVQRGKEHAAGVRSGLPSTIRATLLDRMRHLDADERRILLQAAVIGRSFELSVLAETLEVEIGALLPALQHARDLQLVEEETATVFRFRHALTREAIYGEFLGAQVQPLHRFIATVLERSVDEDGVVAQLAYHWWMAGDVRRATSYNERAGDAAAAAHAHEDAVVFYLRAIAPPETDLALKGRLIGKIAERRLAAGSIAEARAALVEAAEVFRELGDVGTEARYRIQAAKQSYHLGDTDAGEGLARFLERVDPSERIVRNRVNLTVAQIMAVQFRAEDTARYFAFVERSVCEDDPELMAAYRWVKAAMCVMTGDADGYRAEHADRLAAARTGSFSDESPAHVRSSAVYQFALIGLHTESLHEAREAIALARRERSRRIESVAHAFSAFTYLAMGDLAHARAAVDAVRALPTDNLIAVGHAAAWGTLTGVYTGDEDLIAHWFDRLEKTISPTAALLYAPGYAEVMMRRGRVRDAQAVLHAAVASAERARGIFFTLLAVARYGHPDDVAVGREILAHSAAAPSEVVERHALALFDAIVAQRAGKLTEAKRRARTAISGLHTLGYPLLEAAAHEIAGNATAAVELYRRAGASYEVRRLTGEAPTSVAPVELAADPDLSAREREIAELVARGKSNLEIGRALSISHKTVEKHIGAIFAKRGFTSRSQLAAYISRSGAA